jgi:hypothetical protein
MGYERETGKVTCEICGKHLPTGYEQFRCERCEDWLCAACGRFDMGDVEEDKCCFEKKGNEEGGILCVACRLELRAEDLRYSNEIIAEQIDTIKSLKAQIRGLQEMVKSTCKKEDLTEQWQKRLF